MSTFESILVGLWAGLLGTLILPLPWSFVCAAVIVIAICTALTWNEVG